MKENLDKLTFMDTIKKGYSDRILQTEEMVYQKLDRVKDERIEHVDNINTELLSFIETMRSDLVKEVTEAYKRDILKDKKILAKPINSVISVIIEIPE